MATNTPKTNAGQKPAPTPYSELVSGPVANAKNGLVAAIDASAKSRVHK